MSDKKYSEAALPVARIDYHLSSGGVLDSVEYSAQAAFLHDLKEGNPYGMPVSLVLFADANGETISNDFVQEMDPQPLSVEVSYVNVPVYYETGDYAREHNQLPAFRASNKVNEACRQCIDKAISTYYDGHILDSRAYTQVIEQFGYERTMSVLANTIRSRDWDERFSRENKAWASGIRVPDNRNMMYCVLNSHSVLVELFTRMVRSRYHLAKNEDRSKPLRTPRTAARRKPSPGVER